MNGPPLESLHRRLATSLFLIVSVSSYAHDRLNSPGIFASSTVAITSMAQCCWVLVPWVPLSGVRRGTAPAPSGCNGGLRTQIWIPGTSPGSSIPLWRSRPFALRATTVRRWARSRSRTPSRSSQLHTACMVSYGNYEEFRFFTGLRQSKHFALQISDCDVKAGRISIKGHRRRPGKEPAQDQPGSRIRSMPPRSSSAARPICPS